MNFIFSLAELLRNQISEDRAIVGASAVGLESRSASTAFNWFVRASISACLEAIAAFSSANILMASETTVQNEDLEAKAKKLKKLIN